MVLSRIYFFLALLVPAFAFSDSPAESYVKKSQELNLSEDRHWLRLGHYRAGLFGPKSEVDGAAFFVSKDGKTNPKAELEETIRSLFAPVVPPSDKQEEQHPHCKYPARLRFLTKRLGIDRNQLPKPDCKFVTKFKEIIPHESVWLVFSAYYLGSPSSTFGHTFLRFGRSKADQNSQRQELLDYGINYAANAETSNPLLYAFAGMFGGFPGVFSTNPYYYKVREYNDFETRDLWSYELKLTAEERETLLDHLWELSATHFDYFFLTENCSYHVLAAIEAVMPETNLLARLPFWAIPSDTIKSAGQEKGLIGEINYRASIRTQLEARLAQLNDEDRKVFEKLLAERKIVFPDSVGDASRAKILDALSDWMDFQYPNDAVTPEPERAKWKLAILSSRARVPLQSDTLVIPPPQEKRPDLGHKSMRVGIGGASTSYSGPAISANVRFALHDLLDDSLGYPKEAQIEFLNVRSRFYPNMSSFVLDEIAIVRTKALLPFSYIDKKNSFRMELGMRRNLLPSCPECFTGFFEIGQGIAFPIASRLLVYAFLDGEVGLPWRLGLGPRIGTLLDLGKVKWQTEGAYHFLFFAPDSAQYFIDSRLRWNATENFGVETNFGWHLLGWEAGAGLYLFL